MFSSNNKIQIVATMNSMIALDVGERRIGVAIANMASRLPRPLTTLQNDHTTLAEIKKIVSTESVEQVVVGLPRNLSGDDTDQTRYVREFAQSLEGISVKFQDEALTSKKAESELRSRGKPYEKSDIDALAATYILEDYLAGAGNKL